MVSGKEILNHQTFKHLSAETGDAFGAHFFTGERRHDITVLDVYGEIATATADGPEWVNHLHLAGLKAAG